MTIPCDREVPWLSEVREDWEVAPLKTVATLNATTLSDSTPDDEVLRYVDISAVSADGMIAEPEVVLFGAAPSRARRVTKPGDTLVSTVRTYLRAVATVADSHGDLIASTGFAVVTPGRRMVPEFLSYWLRSTWFVDEVCARSVGVSYPATNASEVGSLPVAVPPLPTQRAIADFLDRKTAAIDALIEKKQKLLDLLAEKRTALINRAVTKGLDPNVPMKDSGVPWIGEIPAHWEVKRLKRISPSQTVGVVVNPSSYIQDSGEHPFVYGSDISAGRIDEAGCRRISEVSSSSLPKSQLHKGDIVVVRVGDPGVAAVVPPSMEGANCASVMLVRGDVSFDSNWLCWLMNSPSGRENVWLVAYGAAQKQFNISHAVDFLYPVPPLLEQRRISAFIARSDTRLGELTTATETVIDKLREYRQALITAAVTGQIDVEAA